MSTQPSQTTINGLQLFKSLIKDGCEWHGDVLSRKWSEQLFIPKDGVEEAARRTLESYTEGSDYKWDESGQAIWIA